MASVYRRARVFTMAVLVVFLGGTVGCANQSPRLASSWPKASVEATIAAPPGMAKWPLTGRAQPVGSGADRAPFAVLLTRRPANRQTAGIGSADVVYEWGGSSSDTQVEALVQSSLPKSIGPIGPPASIAQVIAQQYGAVQCSLSATASSPMPDASGEPGAMTPLRFPTVFSGGPAGAPGGVYLLPRKASATIPRMEAAVHRLARLYFSASVDATQPISSVTVPLSANAAVHWSYVAGTRSYLRAADGREQRDVLTGKTIAAQNVVVVWARPEEGGSPGGSAGLSLTGQGQVSVFRDGIRSDGHWRATSDSPPRFTAEDDAPILLAPGATWFEIIPLTANITLE
jgi:Protein of unknown function (DUF3048) C-terminal domain/Protein of unknown function (DUF3048) N-terminal domain